MAYLNTTELISVLSKLQHNYTSLAQYWYDIFYNPEPKQVSIDYYDKEGKKIVITIDNLARIKQNIGGTSGAGAPDSTVTPNFGTTHHDTENGKLYVYIKDTTTSDENAGLWDEVITAEVFNSTIIRDVDPIDNKVEVRDGVVYIASDTHKVYMGRNGAWERIDAAPSLVNRQEFKIASGDDNVVINGLVLDAACENKNTMSVYVDGVILNQDKYTIHNNGFILKFTEPLMSPEEGKSIDVVVKYFTNLCLYEDYWVEEETEVNGQVVKHKHFLFAKDLFETLQEITDRLNTVFVDETGIREDLRNINQEIEDLKETLRDAVAITVGDITAEVKAIGESVKNDRNAVQNLHGTVRTWYDQMSLMRNEVAATKADITDDVAWLRELFADPETGQINFSGFVYIDDFKEAMTNVTNDYNSKITDARQTLTNNIDAVEAALTARINNVETTLSDTIETVEGKFDDEVAELWEAIENNNDNLKDNIDNQIKDLTAETQTAITNIQTTINIVANSLATAEADIDNCENRLDIVEDRCTQSEDRLTVTEGRLGDHDSRIGEAEDNIEEGANRITSLEGRMDDAEDRLDDAEDRLDSAESRLDSAEGRLDDAESRLDSAEDRIGVNEVDIEDLKKRMKAAEDRLDADEAAIDSLDTAIGEFKESVDEEISNVVDGDGYEYET